MLLSEELMRQSAAGIILSGAAEGTETSSAFWDRQEGLCVRLDPVGVSTPAIRFNLLVERWQKVLREHHRHAHSLPPSQRRWAWHNCHDCMGPCSSTVGSMQPKEGHCVGCRGVCYS